MRHGGLTRDPSGSNTEAFVECTSSHVLPQHDARTGRANRGTDGHDYLTAVINQRPLDRVDGAKYADKFPFKEALEGVGLTRSETAYVVNVKKRTSRFVGIELDRKYPPLEDYEIPLSIDVEGFKGGMPWLRDAKFGTYASQAQLLMQGMALAFHGPERPHPAHEVDVGFWFIDPDTHGAKYEVDARVLTLEELDDRAALLVKAFDRVKDLHAVLVAGSSPRTVEGPWCTYCGALPHCPSKMKLVRALIDGEFNVHEQIATMTPAQRGEAWVKYQSAKRLVEKIGDSFKELVETTNQPIPLANGKLVQLSKTKGWAYFDKDKTTTLLKKLGARPDQISSAMKVRADSVSLKEMKR